MARDPSRADEIEREQEEEAKVSFGIHIVVPLCFFDGVVNLYIYLHIENERKKWRFYFVETDRMNEGLRRNGWKGI